MTANVIADAARCWHTRKKAIAVFGGSKLRAAIFKSPRNFEIKQIAEPRLEPDSVIVKVKKCGICGSDLHFFKTAPNDGALLGHEFSGEVVEIGSRVENVDKGDRVVAAGGRGCGECYWCRSGQYIHCSRLGFVGYAVPGAFAEYCAVPAFKIGQYAAKLPANVSDDAAATAEPLAVALYAVNQTDPQPDDNVVVIGLGIIGIFIVQILKARGVKKIIASGRRATRLQLASRAGAEVVVDGSAEDIVKVVRQTTGTRGADIVYECAGTEATFNQALQAVHRGGKVDMVGLYEEEIRWNPSFIAGNDLTLIGCGLHWDLPGAVDLLKTGQVNTNGLITHHYPLERITEAFLTQQNDKEAIKVMIDL